MRQDRFLTGILIGIGLLIVAALAVFFSRQRQPSYVSDASPDGVVHNYVVAVLNRDYPRAYGYLADLPNKPTLDAFRQSFALGKLNPSTNGVKIGEATVSGDDASVELSIVYSPGDPFSTREGGGNTAQLVRQNGQWKISSMPAYYLWDYNWYQTPPK